MCTSSLIKKVEEAILSLEEEELKEAEGIGLCGSLVRGDFTDRSDIDIFVIVKEKEPGVDVEGLWYRRMSKVLERIDRDITVLVYSMKGLKEICNWYVLRLASEGILIFDSGKIAELFGRIKTSAKEAGLIEESDGKHRFWRFKKIKLGQVREVKLR